MGRLWQDVRYGMRMLRKSPGFTAIALVTLAIGIGANTIMFTVVDALLLRPTQVKDAHQLVLCNARNAHGRFPYSAFCELRHTNPAFSDVMAYDTDLAILTLVRAETVKRVYAMFVSANYFCFLGVAPAHGRSFLPEEEQCGAEPVAVLSYNTWQRHGADPAIVGTQVAINGTFFRVVGIAPRQFTGTTIIGPDVWLPLGSYGLVGHLGRDKPERPPSESWNYPGVAPVGRLKRGLTMSAAEAQLQPLVPRLKENHPRWWQRSGTLYLGRLPRLIAANEGDDRAFLSGASLFLMGVSGAVLLIACLNLANMAIVRGAGRHREFAVRMALGGGRLRLMQQLLIESLLLAVLGGTLGLGLAFWGTRILNALIAAPQFPFSLAGSLGAGLDGRVLAATLGFCLIAAVLSGIKPALRLSRRETLADLKQAGREVVRATGRVRGPHGSSVICQIALSVVLVMGAALFTRSALETAPASCGINSQGKFLIEVDPLVAGYGAARSQQVCDTLAERLRSMPGVETVGVSASFPFADGGGFGGSVREYVPGSESPDIDPREELRRLARPGAIVPTVYAVGTRYFEAMKMPLLRGRPFNALDRVPDAEKVVIIDERLARGLRSDGNALGCLIQYGWRSSPPARVIGIVPALRTVSDNKSRAAQIYVPMAADDRPVFVHLSVARPMPETETTLFERVRTEARRIDAGLPIVSVTTLADFHKGNPFVWLWGLGARLALAFGAMALFLASLGIYAVKGYMVASRTAEIGIRKALGATGWNVVGMVLREGMVLAVAGLAIGLFLALTTARLIGSLFYGISPIDPWSIAATLALLGAASLLAGYVPARRAARIDPMAALRCE